MQRERLLLARDFPPDGSFRDFALEFTVSGKMASVPACIEWKLGIKGAKAKKTDTSRPTLAMSNASLGKGDGDTQTDPLGDEETIEFEKKVDDLDGNVLASTEAMKRAQVFLAGYPCILERRAGGRLPRSPPYVGGKRSFTIADGGEAKAVIVTGGELARSYERDVQGIVQALQSELQMITGAAFAVPRGEAGDREPSIEIGRTSRAEREGVAALTETLNHDGFAIRITPERLFVVGATARGTRYGVNYLLNHILRARKYHPDPLWHVYPYEPTLQLPEGECTAQPDFLLRSLSTVGFYDEELATSDVWWMNYNGLSYHEDSHPQIYMFHHNMEQIFSDWLRLVIAKEVQAEVTSAEGLKDGGKEDETDEFDEDGSAKKKEDPADPRVIACRIFSQFTDKNASLEDRFEQVKKVVLKSKSGWQPCYSDPDTARICFEAACEAFEKDPELMGFSLAQNDGGGWCTCDRCLALLKGQPAVTANWYKYWNFSPIHCTFVNRVAQRVAEKYPGKMVGGLCYHSTAYPPRDMTYAPNTYLLRNGYCEDADWEFKNNVLPWRGYIPRIGIYHYAFPLVVPRMLLDEFQKGLQHHVKEGGNLYYAEAFPAWQIEGPKLWLMARLLWDTDADVEGLLGEYCEDLFGEAAAPMHEYWRRCLTVYKETRAAAGLSAYAGPLARGRALDVALERLKEPVQRAAAVAQDPLVRARIECVKTPQDTQMTTLAGLGRVFNRGIEAIRPLDHPIPATVRLIAALDEMQPAIAAVTACECPGLVSNVLKTDHYLPWLALTAVQREANSTVREMLAGDKPVSLQTFQETFDRSWQAIEGKIESDAERAILAKMAKSTASMRECVAFVPSIKTGLTIDGTPDDAFIKEAARLEFSRPREEGDPQPLDRTEIYLGYDREKLYITSVSGEDKPQVYPELSRTNFAFLYTGDSLATFLCPAGEEDKGMSLQVDVENVHTYRRTGGHTNWTTNAKYGGRFHAGQKQWVLEIAVPFSDLEMDVETTRILMGNFLRHYRAENEDLFKGPGPRECVASWFRPAGGWGAPAQSGLLILK
jgi:hypothetical protein